MPLINSTVTHTDTHTDTHTGTNTGTHPNSQITGLSSITGMSFNDLLEMAIKQSKFTTEQIEILRNPSNVVVINGESYSAEDFFKNVNKILGENPSLAKQFMNVCNSSSQHGGDQTKAMVVNGRVVNAAFATFIFSFLMIMFLLLSPLKIESLNQKIKRLEKEQQQKQQRKQQQQQGGKRTRRHKRSKKTRKQRKH